MPSFTPTDEQLAIIDALGSNADIVVSAGAGCGKTASLVMAAEAHPRKKMRYTALNKAVVLDAQGKFPSNVIASTAHSIAFGAVGRTYRERLNGARPSASSLVAAMRIQDAYFDLTDGGRKRLSATYLAGCVTKLVRNFEMSGVHQPEWYHAPIVEGIDKGVESGRGPNNRELAHTLVRYARAMWEDLQRPEGWAKFDHSTYVKIWSLSSPQLGVDVLLLDEAQDVSGALLSVVNAQHDTQVILCGDENQAIYQWAGAIDSMSKAEVDVRLTLSESWRFGPGVAATANQVLAELPTELRITGSGPPTTFGPVDVADAELWRTNAGAIGALIRHLEAGRKPALVRGGKNIVTFAKAAIELKDRGWTSHFELAPFTSWAEVQDFTDSDIQGGELKTLVKIIDAHGPEKLIDMINRLPDENRADVVISTQHVSKGREWPVVRLGSDNPDPEIRELSDEDLRLLYVGVTRAKRHLDIEDVAFFNKKPAAVLEPTKTASPGAAYTTRRSEE